jgi:hypothetical protein
VFCAFYAEGLSLSRATHPASAARIIEQYEALWGQFPRLL